MTMSADNPGLVATAASRMRVVSTGELRDLLFAWAEDPESGAGWTWRRLPVTISRMTYEELDEDGQRFYVPDESSLIFRVDPVKFGATSNGTRSGRAIYTTYMLPPGSYDAWLVRRK